MKIKIFKIYIHIIVLSFFAKIWLERKIFQNVVIHEKPISIKEIKFRNSDLLDVDLTNKKGNIMIINFWATWCALAKRNAVTGKINVQIPRNKGLCS